MTDSTPPTDWATLVLNPELLARIDRLAQRRFGQPGLAEEAATYALEKISRDNWAACRRYSGAASPSTYLLTLVSHAIEEFSRHRFGRPRPPEWLKREGELWVRVWRFICLERQAPQSVIDRLCQNQQRDPAFVKNVIARIKAKLPWCGASPREIPADCEECGFEQELASEHLDEHLLGRERESTLLQLHQLFFAEDCPSEETMTDTPNWQALRDRLNLSAEEKLLLKLVHQQGLKHKQIAAMLGMPAYQPGRLLKALHQRIATVLRECNSAAATSGELQEINP